MNNIEPKRMWLVPVAQLQQETKEEKTQEFDHTEDENVKTAKTLQYIPEIILTEYDARNPLQQLIEKLIVKAIKNEEGFTPILIIFEGKDMIDLRTFGLKVGEYTTDFNFDMKKSEFVRFKKYLHAKAKRKLIYSCAGVQNDKFIYKNGYFCFVGEKFIFIPKVDETKDFDCLENSLISLQNTCRPELFSTGQNCQEVARKFFSNLVLCCKNSNTLLCFGTILACCFWDIFQKYTQGFPLIFFLGQSHSGKSTLLYCISSIFGMNDSIVMAGNSTIYAITRELGSRLSIPVIIEELEEKFFEKSDGFVKNIYNGNQRERGTKNGTEQMPIFTTIVAASNYRFKSISEQLFSRILVANMKKSDFDYEKFAYFDENSRKELSLILPLILSFRDKVIQLHDRIYQMLKQLIPNHSGTRYLSNIAIGCTMWCIINVIVGCELVNWQKLALSYSEEYEKMLASKITDADMAMRFISKLIVEEHIEYGIDYKLVHDVILRLNLRKFVEKYNILYGKNSSDMLTMSTFCHSVEDDSRFDTTRKTMDIGKTISVNISEQEYLLAKIKEFKVSQPYRGRYENEDEI